MIELAPVTAETWVAVARLELAPEQEGLVSPNVWSLAEAGFFPGHQPRVFLHGGEPVGFCMYTVDDEAPASGLFWLFRYMVAAEHQGKGYGRAALPLVLEEMRAAGARTIRTMHRPENSVAARLYASAGFRQVGVLDDGDLELELMG